MQLDGVEGAAHVEPPLLQDASFWWHALPAIATCALLLLSLWLQRRHPTQVRCMCSAGLQVLLARRRTGKPLSAKPDLRVQGTGLNANRCSAC